MAAWSQLGISTLTRGRLDSTGLTSQVPGKVPEVTTAFRAEPFNAFLAERTIGSVAP